jgi:hypothetical protein
MVPSIGRRCDHSHASFLVLSVLALCILSLRLRVPDLIEGGVLAHSRGKFSGGFQYRQDEQPLA